MTASANELAARGASDWVRPSELSWIDAEQGELDVNSSVLDDLSSGRSTEFAAEQASDWVWVSEHGFTNAGQEVDCEALDFEPFGACNELELAVGRASNWSNGGCRTGFRDDVEEAQGANVELTVSAVLAASACFEACNASSLALEASKASSLSSLTNLFGKRALEHRGAYRRCSLTGSS